MTSPTAYDFPASTESNSTLTGAGTVSWSNHANITADDSSYASATEASSSSKTHFLRSYGYTFGWGGDTVDTIDGIQVEIHKRHDSSANPSMMSTVQSNESRLIDHNAAIAGDDKSTNDTWTLAWVTTTHGGDGDTWNWGSATYDNVNDSDFGFAQTVDLNYVDETTIAEVDYHKIRIYYTAATSENLAWIELLATQLGGILIAAGLATPTALCCVRRLWKRITRPLRRRCVESYAGGYELMSVPA